MGNKINTFGEASSLEMVQNIGTILRQKLVGKILIESFSQNKDELILGFGDEKEDFWIKANFNPDISLLSFPKEFNRAKKNTIELFSEIIKKKVLSLEQHQNERSFHLVFENNFMLMFKLHSKNSNFILFHNLDLIDVFRHNLERDLNINLTNYTIDNEKYIVENLLEDYTHFYQYYSSEFYLQKEKKQVLQILNTKINTTQKYISTATEKLITLETTTNYQQIADVLMANLHLKTTNIDQIELHNFYTNQNTVIKLKPLLSLSKNAENYYRKSKNQKIELSKIEETINRKEKELTIWETLKSEIEISQDLKQIRRIVETNKLLIPKQKIQASVPYTEIEFEGYKIWIGKNAQQNDVLTLKYAHKDDLWLHAKDCPGSHVVLKFQAGKPFPKSVIDRACELAAWFSKKKTESLVPVIVTPKKFVRKIKGSAPGNVVVEQEKILLIAPKGY